MFGVWIGRQAGAQRICFFPALDVPETKKVSSLLYRLRRQPSESRYHSTARSHTVFLHCKFPLCCHFSSSNSSISSTSVLLRLRPQLNVYLLNHHIILPVLMARITIFFSFFSFFQVSLDLYIIFQAGSYRDGHR